MRRERIGRVIGATGGIVAALFWGFLLFGCVVFLIEPPTGVAGLAAIGILPVSVLSAGLFVVSVGNVIVLARRVDTDMPGRVAAVHLVLAAMLAYVKHVWWPPVLGFAAIGISQLVALRLFRKIIHTSSV